MELMLKEYGGDVGELGGGEVDPEMAELEAELKRKEKCKVNNFYFDRVQWRGFGRRNG